MWILLCNKSQVIYCKCPMGTLSYLCWLLPQKCMPLACQKDFFLQLRLRSLSWGADYPGELSVDTNAGIKQRQRGLGQGERMVADAGVTGLKTDRGPPTKHHSLFTDGKVVAIEFFEFPWRAGPCCYLGFSQGEKNQFGWFTLFYLFIFSLQDWALELGPNGMLGKCSPMELHPWVSPFLLRYGLKVALPAFGFIPSWGCSWIYNPPAKVSLLIAGITDFHHSVWFHLGLRSGEL